MDQDFLPLDNIGPLDRVFEGQDLGLGFLEERNGVPRPRPRPGAPVVRPIDINFNIPQQRRAPEDIIRDRAAEDRAARAMAALEREEQREAQLRRREEGQAMGAMMEQQGLLAERVAELKRELAQQGGELQQAQSLALVASALSALLTIPAFRMTWLQLEAFTAGMSEAFTAGDMLLLVMLTILYVLFAKALGKTLNPRRLRGGAVTNFDVIMASPEAKHVSEVLGDILKELP